MIVQINSCNNEVLLLLQVLWQPPRSLWLLRICSWLLCLALAAFPFCDHRAVLCGTNCCTDASESQISRSRRTSSPSFIRNAHNVQTCNCPRLGF